MEPIVRALVVTTVIQIISMFGMTMYMSDRVIDQAKLYSAELVLKARNDTQMQFSIERESLKQYVDRAIERKISQSRHTEGN